MKGDQFARCYIDDLLRPGKLNRAHLEAVCGYTQSYLNRIVNGTITPRVTTVLRILDGLEQLLGRPVGVREVWTLSATPRVRRAKPGRPPHHEVDDAERERIVARIEEWKRTRDLPEATNAA